MFAHGLNPIPTNFTDPGTIAQLQETFLFWRIAKGGPGLPAEGGPWDSAMPAWEKFLNEDEIWEVILFLYDHTGQRPRAAREEHMMRAPLAGVVLARSGWRSRASARRRADLGPSRSARRARSSTSRLRPVPRREGRRRGARRACTCCRGRATSPRGKFKLRTTPTRRAARPTRT